LGIKVEIGEGHTWIVEHPAAALTVVAAGFVETEDAVFM
jgi:hypothetical protein